MMLKLIYKRLNNYSVAYYSYKVSLNSVISIRNIYGIREDQCTDDSNVMEKSTESVAFVKVDVLSKLLRCSTSNALQIVANNNLILQKDNDHLERVSNFICDKMKIEDIVQNPKILTFRKNLAEHHYTVLKEIGFPEENITAARVVYFMNLIKKSTAQLKKLNLIPKTVNPLENMLNILNANQTLQSQVKKNLSYLCDDYEKISTLRLRQVIVSSYLAYKLDLSNEEIFKRMDTYPLLKNKSLKSLIEVIDYLQTIGFSIPKIKKSISVLSGDVSNMETILNLGELHGQNVKNLVYTNPPILLMKPSSLLAIEDFLVQYGITKAQVKESSWIFGLTLSTIKFRLNEINRIPELRAMKLHPRFLSFVTNFKTVKSRYNTLQPEDIKSLSVSYLTCCKTKFEQLQKGSSDGCFGVESILYLSNILNKTPNEVKLQLSLHPKSQRPFNLVNINDVTEFLLTTGISKDQLWNSLGLVLYSHKMVKEVFLKLNQIPELQPFDEWKEHPLFLDLVVYYIEKTNGFTGDGIFRKQ